MSTLDEWRALHYRLAELRFFTICAACSREIDLRFGGFRFDGDFHVHLTCPPGRNVYEKDL